MTALAKTAAMPMSRLHAKDTADVRIARYAYYAGFLFIGQLTIRPALSLTLSDYLFLVSLTLVLMAILRDHAVPGHISRPIFIGSYLLALGAVFSAFGSATPLPSLLVALKFMFVSLVWFWLGTIVLQRSEHVRTAAICWMLSATLNGIGALAQMFSATIIPGTTSSWGRMTGFTQHMNDLGGSSAVAFGVAVSLVAVAPGPARLRRLGALALVIAGLILSGSVGALLAAAAAAIVLVTCARPSPSVFLIALIGTAAILGYGRLQQSEGAPTPLQRVQRVSEDGGTLWTRVDAYRAAASRIADNPLLGVGFAPEGALTNTGSQVHNALLGAWYQGGVLAAAGLATVIGASLATAIHVRKRARTPAERMLVTGLLAGLVAYLVFGLSAPTLFSRYGWAPVALLFAIAQGQRTERVEEGQQVLNPDGEVARPTPTSGRADRRTWGLPHAQ